MGAFPAIVELSIPPPGGVILARYRDLTPFFLRFIIHATRFSQCRRLRASVCTHLSPDIYITFTFLARVEYTQSTNPPPDVAGTTANRIRTIVTYIVTVVVAHGSTRQYRLLYKSRLYFPVSWTRECGGVYRFDQRPDDGSRTVSQ